MRSEWAIKFWRFSVRTAFALACEPFHLGAPIDWLRQINANWRNSEIYFQKREIATLRSSNDIYELATLLTQFLIHLSLRFVGCCDWLRIPIMTCIFKITKVIQRNSNEFDSAQNPLHSFISFFSFVVSVVVVVIIFCWCCCFSNRNKNIWTNKSFSLKLRSMLHKCYTRAHTKVVNSENYIKNFASHTPSIDKR